MTRSVTESLFADLGKFQIGDIVRQALPWIGRYETIYPYWQVRERHYNEVRGEAEYVCASVPYGWKPCTHSRFLERNIFYELFPKRGIERGEQGGNER